MKPLSATLQELILVTEGVLTRPQARDAASWLAPIAAEVRARDARPGEGIPATDAAMVMIIALARFLAGEREGADPWLMLAGATLPLLRGDLFVAIRNEKERGSER